MKKITVQPLSIADLPQAAKPEHILDFHARLPISLKDKLEDAAKEKNVKPNVILKLALEAFLK